MSALPACRIGNPAPWGIDPDVKLWADAVVANGGSVSDGRIALMGAQVAARKAIGTWQLRDDLLWLAAENQAQALTSLKQRRLATAVNSPTFTQDRDYTFNGTTNYVNTGFIPSTHAVNYTPTDGRLDTYDRADVAGGNVIFNAGIGNNLGINTKSGTTALRAQLCSSTVIGLTGSEAADRRGFNSVSRNGSAWKGFRRGVLVGNQTSSSTIAIGTSSIYVGGVNNGGSLASGGAVSIAFFSIGASFSDSQEAADAAITQAGMALLGADV